jgi:long-subunit fatty acid transport protein
MRYGDIEGRDVSGAATGNFSAQDQVMTIGYGRALFDQPETGRIMAGVNGRLLNQEISNQKWSNYTFDAGILWRLPENPLSLGAALQNFGGQLGYEAQSFSPPLNLKAGMAYHPSDELTLALDANSPANADLYFAVGGEYYFLNALALRLGYNTRSSQGSGLTAGFGVALKQVDVEFFYFREIDIDYAFVPYGDLGDTHRVTVNLKFGAD